MKFFLGVLSVALISLSKADDADDDICISADAKYTVSVDPYASQYGFFTFLECPTLISPTIGMRLDTIYTFDQSDRSNYYHPMGFAYNVDGALAGSDELEPGNTPPGSISTCAVDLKCPSPIYFKNDVMLGDYSNLETNPDSWVGDGNFGLDDYEPEFFVPLTDWSVGEYTVKLKFTVEDIDQDIFYFCHIHAGMSGRIKILEAESDTPLVVADGPALPDNYEYVEPSAFDMACGTVGLEDFQTSATANNQCPITFVCNDDSDASPALNNFIDCINAMDCKMLQGMTSSVDGSQDLGALFSYQMIPHHINAVNMAKALLKTGDVGSDCPDLTAEGSDDCDFEVLVRSIIVVQNLQIQAMEGVLIEGSYGETNDCEINLPIREE